jgi:hypothetical protein
MKHSYSYVKLLIRKEFAFIILFSSKTDRNFQSEIKLKICQVIRDISWYETRISALFIFRFWTGNIGWISLKKEKVFGRFVTLIENFVSNMSETKSLRRKMRYRIALMSNSSFFIGEVSFFKPYGKVFISDSGRSDSIELVDFSI